MLKNATMFNAARNAILTRAAMLICTVALALLPACNTANTTTAGSGSRSGSETPKGLGSNVEYEQIITNGWLNYKANIVGVREGTVTDNLKRVAVDVYSDQSALQRFSYKFEWFDASGMPVVNPTGSLISVSIHPKETITLSSVATSATATQWRLTFLDHQQR